MAFLCSLELFHIIAGDLDPRDILRDELCHCMGPAGKYAWQNGDVVPFHLLQERLYPIYVKNNLRLHEICPKPHLPPYLEELRLKRLRIRVPHYADVHSYCP